MVYLHDNVLRNGENAIDIKPNILRTKLKSRKQSLCEKSVCFCVHDPSSPSFNNSCCVYIYIFPVARIVGTALNI